MKTKSFNKYVKRHIFDGRLASFNEIVDDSTMYPFHKERRWNDGTLNTPEWHYENFRQGIHDNGFFFCYAKSSHDRKTLEAIGIRSDYVISTSKFKKDEVLKVSTNDMYKYPSESNVKEFFIKITDATCFIQENTFWWNYQIKIVENDV